MTPEEPIILTIIRGSERIHEKKEGHYDIWTLSKDGGSVVSIRDCHSNRVLCDDLPIYNMTINTPFIGIQTRGLLSLGTG